MNQNVLKNDENLETQKIELEENFNYKINDILKDKNEIYEKLKDAETQIKTYDDKIKNIIIILVLSG